MMPLFTEGGSGGSGGVSIGDVNAAITTALDNFQANGGDNHVPNEAALAEVGEFTFSADGNQVVFQTAQGVRRADLASE